MGVLVGEDEVVERWWGVGRLWPQSADRPFTASPSNGDGWPLDGRCMVGKLVSQLVRRFGGRFGPLQVYDNRPVDPRQLNVVLWIKSTWIKGGEAVWRPSRGSVTWQGGWGHRAMPGGIGQRGMWAHGPPATSHCLLCTSFVHFCNFSCIQINFRSTSETR